MPTRNDLDILRIETARHLAIKSVRKSAAPGDDTMPAPINLYDHSRDPDEDGGALFAAFVALVVCSALYSLLAWAVL